jgi:hypothetical protein
MIADFEQDQHRVSVGLEKFRNSLLEVVAGYNRVPGGGHVGFAEASLESSTP